MSFMKLWPARLFNQFSVGICLRYSSLTLVIPKASNTRTRSILSTHTQKTKNKKTKYCKTRTRSEQLLRRKAAASEWTIPCCFFFAVVAQIRTSTDNSSCQAADSCTDEVRCAQHAVVPEPGGSVRLFHPNMLKRNADGKMQIKRKTIPPQFTQKLHTFNFSCTATHALYFSFGGFGRMKGIEQDCASVLFQFGYEIKIMMW